MGAGSKRNDSKKVASTDLEGSFKSINTTIQQSDFDHVTKLSFLKRLGLIPGMGILLAALSSVCFSTGSLCCRLLGDEINSNQVVIASGKPSEVPAKCSKSLIQLVVYLVVSYWKCTPLWGVKGEIWPLFFRACFGYTSFAGSYMAIQMIGLSDASAIVFSAPVFCVIFAFFIIGEPFRCSNLLTLVMVIFGIILICKPEILIEHHKVEIIEDGYRLIGSIIAFVACLSIAMTYIALRKLTKTSSQVSIVWFSFVSIIFSCVLNSLLFDYKLPSTQLGWILILVNGLCGVFGQLFLTLALKLADAGPVSMARTLDIVMSFVYQVTVLHQSIEWHTIIGAILICVGVIITSVGVPVYNKIKSYFLKTEQNQESSF